jgi:hypothetical protein
VCAAMVVTLLSPMLRNRDSFPLSTYPMYADVRSESDDFIVVTATDESGAQRVLPMGVVAQTDDPLIARGVVNSAERSGELVALCQQIAARSPDWARGVIIANERHRLLDAARGNPSLVNRRELTRCAVVP